MSLFSDNDRLVWGTVPDEPDAHCFMVFDETRISVCQPPRFRFEALQDVSPEHPRCPGCVTALEDLDRPYPRTRADGQPGQPYSVYRHQQLIDAVHAEFEAAGGSWAALAADGPLDTTRMRAIKREFEAVVREHHDNFPVLLREATGYLEQALSAVHRWDHDRGGH